MVDGAKLKGFLKLTREERKEYGDNPKTWAKAYLKDHPCAFQPSLQSTIRKWMSDFSNLYKLSEQSGVGKKDWNKVVNYAATAVAECIKQKYLSLDIRTTDNYAYAMQEAFKIYYNRNLTGLLSQEITFAPIKTMLLYLKQKKQDAEKLKKQRGTLSNDGIRVMNRLAVMTNDDVYQYNENVVPELDKLMVPYENYEYKDPEYVDQEFCYIYRYPKIIEKPVPEELKGEEE
jgi:transposase